MSNFARQGGLSLKPVHKAYSAHNKMKLHATTQHCCILSVPVNNLTSTFQETSFPVT